MKILIIVGLLIGVGFALKPAAQNMMSNSRFERALEEISIQSIHKSDAEIKHEILETAQTHGISLTDDAIHLLRPARKKINMVVSYCYDLPILSWKHQSCKALQFERELGWAAETIDNTQQKVNTSFTDKARAIQKLLPGQ